MLTRYGVFVCALLLCSALAACDSMETEDMLTEGEVHALLSAINDGFGALGADSTVFATVSVAVPQGGMFAGALVDTAYACPEGGSIALQGTVEPGASDDGEFVGQFDFTSALSRCAVTAEDISFILDSASGVRQQGAVSVEFLETDDGLMIANSNTGVATGEVDWELGDRSGRCDMNLSTDVKISLILEVDPDADTLFATDIDAEGGTTGVLCGMNVEVPAELPENPEDLFAPEEFEAETL